jgi:serine protease Do
MEAPIMQTKKRLWGIIGATLLAGTLIGLIIAANFDFTNIGLADNRPKSVLGSNQAPVDDNFDAAGTGKAFVDVAKRVTPTVVSITSAKVVRVRNNPLFDLFHDDPWGRNDRNNGREFRQQGLGSGVIISDDGYVLTNNHVIQGAEEISVLIDNKEYAAKLVGTDPKTDVAVIKVDAKNLPVVALGNSDDLEVGEWVIAVGNPFSKELAHTVTVGIVSGKGRAPKIGDGSLYYEDFIQTDAAINPGNSGGALVNLRGELVGINTAIVTGGYGGGNVGIGFAIPINLARHVMQSLIDVGRVIRGYIGVDIQRVSDQLAKAYGLPEAQGALVNGIRPNSPAQDAGLKVEDIVIEFDGKKIRDSNHLINLVALYKPGTRVPLTLLRKGKEVRMSIVLGERPEDDQPVKLTSTENDATELGLQVATLTPSLASRYDIDPNEEGVVVTDIDEGSQAAEEGIRVGDLIREVNRQPVTTLAEFRRAMGAAAGDVVLLRVWSSAAKRNLFVALRREN